MAISEEQKQEIEARLEHHAKNELGLKSVPEQLRRNAYRYPEYTLAYGKWRDSVIMKDGALDHKLKLLIAAGVVTSMRSEAAARTYGKLAMVAGATKEELIEALNCARVFGGGPTGIIVGGIVEILESGKELYPG